MEIIPAIDLLDGQVVRLKQGDYSKVTYFDQSPVDLAISCSLSRYFFAQFLSEHFSLHSFIGLVVRILQF